MVCCRFTLLYLATNLPKTRGGVGIEIKAYNTSGVDIRVPLSLVEAVPTSLSLLLGKRF